MRRWDRLQDSYMEEYRARGVSALTVSYTESRLDRWGRWLKKRRPRVAIEHIDADTITRYMDTCASFRSKSTVYGMLSTMRGFGDYLVRQGLWKINPLRWMKGRLATWLLGWNLEIRFLALWVSSLKLRLHATEAVLRKWLNEWAWVSVIAEQLHPFLSTSRLNPVSARQRRQDENQSSCSSCSDVPLTIIR